jgi:hypothetical protein
MRGQDPFGLIVLVAGIALVVLSALADPIGIGGKSGFGWKQGTGVGVGALVAIVGAVLVARARSSQPR